MKAISRIARDRSSAYAGRSKGFFGGGAVDYGGSASTQSVRISRNAGKAKGSGS